MSLVFESDRCTGCQACQMACLDQRDIRPLEGQLPLLRVEPAEVPGRFRAVSCSQCGACAEVCPTGCLQKNGGTVTAEESLCIGCRACGDACPRGVITYIEETVQKCDGCAGRRAAGLLPACVHTCPTGALSWEE